MADNENVDVETPEGEVPEAVESEVSEAAETSFSATSALRRRLILALRPSRQRNCRQSSVRNVQRCTGLDGDLRRYGNTVDGIFCVGYCQFAQMNVPKFKEVSGSDERQYGRAARWCQWLVKPPTADNIIADQFMQAKVEPTALSTISEQTTLMRSSRPIPS